MHAPESDGQAVTKRRRPGTSKLTARKVREIRTAWVGPPFQNQAALAREYGANRSDVSLGGRALTWTDVPVPVAPAAVHGTC